MSHADSLEKIRTRTVSIDRFVSHHSKVQTVGPMLGTSLRTLLLSKADLPVKDSGPRWGPGRCQTMLGDLGNLLGLTTRSGLPVCISSRPKTHKADHTCHSYQASKPSQAFPSGLWPQAAKSREFRKHREWSQERHALWGLC